MQCCLQKIRVVLAEYGVSGAENLSVYKKLGVKLIVHFHGFDATAKHIIKKYGPVYKEMFEYADAIIAVSKKMKERIKILGCPENKLILNSYGPNSMFPAIHPSFSNKKFIAIGRFVDKKAPYYTLMAFAKVAEKHESAHLVMIGEGSLLETCKNLTKVLNLEKKVHFTGAIAPQEIMNQLENALAFVQHSITAESGDMEGLPHVFKNTKVSTTFYQL